MTEQPKKPRCGYMLQGPKVGRRVVLWQRHCLRPATVGTDRCWQHQEWKMRFGGRTS